MLGLTNQEDWAKGELLYLSDILYTVGHNIPWHITSLSLIVGNTTTGLTFIYPCSIKASIIVESDKANSATGRPISLLLKKVVLIGTSFGTSLIHIGSDHLPV